MRALRYIPRVLLTFYFPDESTATHVVSCYRTTNRAWDRSRYERGFISSPNVNWCPRTRPFACPVFLRADGTFGEDDPVSWPQYRDPNAPHLPCIPTFDPDPQSPVYLFRRGLCKSHVTFTDFFEDGLRVAKITNNLARNLDSAVSQTVKQAEYFLSTTEELHPRLKRLIQSLKSSARKLVASEAPLPELRLIFGIASRFCLESIGYVDYHSRFLPSLASMGHPTVNHLVVGVWTTEEAIGTHYLKMGIPVWILRHSSHVPHSPDQNVKYQQPRGYCSRPRLPEDCFRDDGHATGHPVLFHERQDKPGVLLKAIDSWIEKKLEEWQRCAYARLDL